MKFNNSSKITIGICLRQFLVTQDFGQIIEDFENIISYQLENEGTG